nr:hypothetical protein [Pseudomonas asuensis]
MKFQRVLAARLGLLAVTRSGFEWHLQLYCDQTQQRREQLLFHREHNAGKAHVAELHSQALVIGQATPLPDDGQVDFTKHVVTYQIIVSVREYQQAFLLNGAQERTADRAVSFRT